MRPYSLCSLARRSLLTAHRCPRHLGPAPPPAHPQTIQQRRAFWGFSKETPRSTTPGIESIERLVGSLDTQEGRPPSDELLVESFRQLVGSWKTRGSTILDEHAHGLARTYEYLRTSRGVTIPVSDLRAGLLAVQAGVSAHQAGLARMLFAGIADATQEDVLPLVHVLCRSGNTVEAVGVVRRYGLRLADGGWRRAWEWVLRGFARERDEVMLLQTWELLLELGVDLTPRLYQPVVEFFCDKGDLENAKVWYEKILDAGLVPSLYSSGDVLRLFVEKGRLDWAQEILDTILAGGKKGPIHAPEMTNISKDEWDVVLQWSAVMEEGLGRVDTLLDLMADIAKKVKSRPAPDIETTNNLIRFAISRKDTNMAKHFLDLTAKRRYGYNRTTLELQMEYQILAGNVEGARKVYKELRREEIPKSYDAREAKQLLRALCKNPAPDIDKVRQVYLDLNDWGVKLETDTLIPLLVVFLEKCVFQSVIELLHRDCTHYSAKDRRKVIHEIGEYIGRNTTSIEAAWDSYQILYQFFPELSVRQRTDIMRLFFALDRSDMATLVFQHMRGTPARRPTNHTYAFAFMGVAHARDLDALKVVHNALKLDQLIDPDTMLMNTLMAAYSHCGIPERALQFWEDVKKSREGPDYATISIVLDTCGQLWGGGIPLARIVWGQLRAMGVTPTIGNYCSYIEALGRRGFWDESLRIAKEMESLDGVKPDFELLGTLYATMKRSRKSEVQEWAQLSYPAEWAEVQKLIVVLPEDVSGEETLECLGIGQLQRLAEQSRRMMAVLDEKKLPEYGM